MGVLETPESDQISLSQRFPQNTGSPKDSGRAFFRKISAPLDRVDWLDSERLGPFLGLMEVEKLQNRIAKLERENAQLRQQNLALENQGRFKTAPLNPQSGNEEPDSRFWECSHSLTKQQVERYSRQLLLHSFGAQGEFLEA